MADIATTKNILLNMPAEMTPKIEGVHGTGKTEVIRQLCADPNGWNMRCVELQGSQLSDVGDLVGLQQIVEWFEDEEQEVYVDGKKKTVTVKVKRQETAWIPPYWFPKDGKPFCLFLDEINRAALPIKRAMMQIGNDHRLLNFVLPEGTRVVCAVNPNNEGDYDVEEFDDAESDRFYSIRFTPTVQEALNYWRTIDVPDVICAYIDANPEDLDPYDFAQKNGCSGHNDSVSTLNVKQSRRSWVRLGKCIKAALAKDESCFEGVAGNAYLKLLTAGWVGEGIANHFVSFYNQHGNGIKPMNIIEATGAKDKIWAKVEKMAATQPLEIVRLGNAVCAALAKVEDKFVENHKPTEYGKTVAANWYKFLKTIPQELAAQIHMQGVENARKLNKADKKTNNWVGRLNAIDKRIVDFYVELVDYDI